MALVILYEPILVAVGATVGQRIMQLRVRNYSKYRIEQTEANINIFSSLLRYISQLALGWISLLTIHSDKYGQAIHDKLGNSIMTFK